MCAISYLTLLRNSAGHRPERITLMATVLHAANLAMSSGQAFDLSFETAAHVTLDAYTAMIDGKTGVLFGAACELGALAAGAPVDRARAYGELGRAYGRAFQIRDDILGTWGSAQETGKVTRCDVARRKWTYPLVWALAGPSTAHRDAIAARYASCSPLCPADVAVVVDALDALGAHAAADAAYLEQLALARRIAAAHRIDRSGNIAALIQAGGLTTLSCAAISTSSSGRGNRRKSTIESTSTRTTAVRIPSSIG
jgi:geranylgeranyl diphosphate synthase type I